MNSRKTSKQFENDFLNFNTGCRRWKKWKRWIRGWEIVRLRRFRFDESRKRTENSTVEGGKIENGAYLKRRRSSIHDSLLQRWFRKLKFVIDEYWMVRSLPTSLPSTGGAGRNFIFGLFGSLNLNQFLWAFERASMQLQNGLFSQSQPMIHWSRENRR